MRRKVQLLMIGTMGFFSVSAHAALLTFDYEGFVTSVSGPGAAFGIVASVGDPVFGSVTYDSTAVQTTATEADPTLAVYLLDPPSSLSLTIGANPALIRTLRNINIFDPLDFAPGDERDTIQIGSDPIGAFEIFQLGFQGPATVFGTDGLESIAALEATLFQYNNFAGGFLQTGNPNLPPVNQLIFDITSVSFRAIPEPSTLALLAVGAGALAMPLRRASGARTHARK